MLFEQFHALVKCNIQDTPFILKLQPDLNVETDSFRAKVLVVLKEFLLDLLLVCKSRYFVTCLVMTTPKRQLFTFTFARNKERL